MVGQPKGETKFEDMFTCFDTTHERVRRTDERTETCCAMHTRSQGVARGGIAPPPPRFAPSLNFSDEKN